MLHSLFKNTKISSKSGNSESDTSSSRSSSRAAKQKGRRLERAKNIRGLRCSDDDFSADALRGSFFSNEHSSETFSGSTRGSRGSSPSNLVFHQPISSGDASSPLPPPPSSKSSMPQQFAQSHSPRSSPRSWDGDAKDLDGTSEYSSDSTSSSGSFESSASHGIFSSHARHSEGDLQDLARMDFERSIGVAALPRLGVQILAKDDRAQKSAPSSRLTSPVSSPKAWGSKGKVDEFYIRTHADRTQKSAPNSTFTSPESSPRAWGSTTNHLQPGSTPTSSRPSDFFWSGIVYDKTEPSHQQLSSGKGQSKSSWTDAHPLPLPPTFGTTLSSPPSPSSSMVPPRSPSRVELGPRSGKWLKGRLLGSGAFGKVYNGIHSETGEFCAIKVVEYVEDDHKSKEAAKQLAQEIMLLSSLRHPNIVHYKGSDMAEGHLNIYLELVSGGSIYKLYQEFKRLEEPVIRRYTRQILQGLHFLHNKSTVHRDIKCANILVDQEGTVKLADFGMAKQIKEQGAFMSFKGSPYWMAPEVIMQINTGFARAVDIWSLGCTVLEMVTGKPPWSEYEGVAAMFKVSRAEIPPIPDSLSLEGQSFIKLCLQRNPADRPSAAALLQHPFVQIPNDGPDFQTSDNKERSTHQKNDDSLIRLLRDGSQPLRNSKYMHPRSQPGTRPSRSAPVSPRSFYTDKNEFPASTVELPPGFSTPPAHSTRKAGFDLDMGPGKSFNGYINKAGRNPHATNGVPFSHMGEFREYDYYS